MGLSFIKGFELHPLEKPVADCDYEPISQRRGRMTVTIQRAILPLSHTTRVRNVGVFQRISIFSSGIYRRCYEPGDPYYIYD
jgi:hypothetical protein